MNGQNGNGHDNDPPENFDDETPPDGIRVRPAASVEATNLRLALAQAAVHIDVAIGHGEEIARLLADVGGVWTDDDLRKLEDELGQFADQVSAAKHDIVEARHRRRGG